MAFVRYDRVWMSCTGTGAGPLSLVSALPGFMSLASRYTPTDTGEFVVLDGDTAWMYFIGTLTSTTQLAITTVLDSSATTVIGTPVSISLSPTSPKTVFASIGARRLVTINDAGQLTDPTPFRATIFLPTIAAMKAEAVPAAGEMLFVGSGTTFGDHLGGFFYYDASDANAPDNVNTFRNDNNSTGLYKRVRIDVQSGLVSYIAGANTDRVTFSVPINLPTRANATGLQDRSLVEIGGVLKYGNATFLRDIPTMRGSFAGVYSTIAALQAEDAASLFTNNQRIILLGSTSSGNRDMLIYYWNTADNTTGAGLDNINKIRPGTGAASTGDGRWNLDVTTSFSTFAESDTTPDVSNFDVWVTHTTSVTVTRLDGKAEGRSGVIIWGGTGTFTLQNGADIVTQDGADLILGAGNKIASYLIINNVAYVWSGGGASGGSILKAALQALSPAQAAVIKSINVYGGAAAGDGFEGQFDWQSTDQSTKVTADPAAGVMVAPTSSATGINGAWRRRHIPGHINADWFGLVPDAVATYTSPPVVLQSVTGTDNTQALQRAFDWLLFEGGGEITIPPKEYKIDSAIVFNVWPDPSVNQTFRSGIKVNMWGATLWYRGTTDCFTITQTSSNAYEAKPLFTVWGGRIVGNVNAAAAWHCKSCNFFEWHNCVVQEFKSSTATSNIGAMGWFMETTTYQSENCGWYGCTGVDNQWDIGWVRSSNSVPGPDSHSRQYVHDFFSAGSGASALTGGVFGCFKNHGGSGEPGVYDSIIENVRGNWVKGCVLSARGYMPGTTLCNVMLENNDYNDTNAAQRAIVKIMDAGTGTASIPRVENVSPTTREMGGGTIIAVWRNESNVGIIPPITRNQWSHFYQGIYATQALFDLYSGYGVEIRATVTNEGRLTVTGTGQTQGNFRGINLKGGGGNPATFTGGFFQDEVTLRWEFWDNTGPLLTMLRADAGSPLQKAGIVPNLPIVMPNNTGLRSLTTLGAEKTLVYLDSSNVFHIGSIANDVGLNLHTKEIATDYWGWVIPNLGVNLGVYFRTASGNPTNGQAGIEQASFLVSKATKDFWGNVGDNASATWRRLAWADEITSVTDVNVFAYIGALTNATGDSTVVNFATFTEVYDTGSDFNATTGVFTAPEEGYYLIEYTVTLGDVNNGVTHTLIDMQIVTSNHTYLGPYKTPTPSSNFERLTMSVLADMQAADTASFRITVSGATKIVDVLHTVGISDSFVKITKVH